MLNEQCVLSEKINEFLMVNKQYKMFGKNKRLIPNLMLDVSKLTGFEEYEIYRNVADAMEPITQGKEVFEYKTTNETIRKQIRHLVYALSDKIKNKAYFSGILIVSITLDFLKLDDYTLFMEFIQEQEWYTIFAVKGELETIYNAVSGIVFVDKPISVSSKDIVLKSPMSIMLDKYGISIDNKKAEVVINSIQDIRNIEDYDSQYDNVLINKVAYNTIKMAAKGNGVLKAKDLPLVLGENKREQMCKKRRREDIKIGFR